jgi:(p)ppGpp synthase/HD superfamily hydrolase
MPKHPIEGASRLDIAIMIAVAGHVDQVDKVGLPYILHPLHVMLQMKTEPERVIAVLHDVLEDCPQISLSDITDRIDITEEEIGALIALTHIKNEPYVDYLKRVLAAGKIAINVKWEDVVHNSSPRRMSGLPEETRKRMDKKYKIATEMLWEGK